MKYRVETLKMVEGGRLTPSFLGRVVHVLSTSSWHPEVTREWTVTVLMEYPDTVEDVR